MKDLEKIIFWTRQIWWRPSYNDCPKERALELLNYAYQKWIKTFDTAPIYGNWQSEILLWKFIQEKNIAWEESFRKKIQIITKFWIRIKKDWEKKYKFLCLFTAL